MKNISNTQIIASLCALETVDGNTTLAVEKIEEANNKLREALEILNGFSVKGKTQLDILLGCMMALEIITGDKGE